ncbi:WASH complex subunit 2 [Aplochiton taeniatus]
MSAFPEGIVNDADKNNYNKKDAQIWERPWTLEEIRQTSVNWSLAADSGLFLCLQDFSQRMLSKTHDIEKQLDGLIRDTKTAECCLHTVFNDFLMLSNTQFIENRVYDEEVEDPVSKTGTLEKQPEQEKTREQKEAELIPKMQEAVNYGLKILDSAFEQLDIKAGNSDSEDEDVTDRVEQILEPKDLYVDRLLPHLIGSQLFMEQDDVGLGDLSSEEMTIDSDRDSVLDSEDGKDADQSDEDFGQEEEMHGGIKKTMGSDEDDEDDDDGDSDIFGESDKYDDDDERGKTDPSFAEELASRIKGELVSKPEGDHSSVENNKDELFKSPKMKDEDFTLFGGKQGLFSGGKGLFDDDEGDLFSDAPKLPLPEEKTKVNSHTSEPSQRAQKVVSGGVSTSAAGQLQSKSRKNVDLFRDDEDDDEDADLFSEKHSNAPPTVINEEVTEEQVKPPEKKSGPPPHIMKAAEKKAEQPQTGGLISEEDSQIFPTIPKGQSKPEPDTHRKPSKAALSLFDDDEGEERNVIEDTKSHKVADVSLFEGIDILSNKSSKTSLDDEEDDFLSKDGPPPMEKTGKKMTQSLFDDDEDDDDKVEPVAYSVAPTSFPSQAVAKNTLKSSEERFNTTSTGVFQDEELLFSQIQLKDNDPDVDLFAPSAKTPVTTAANLVINSAAPLAKAPPPKIPGSISVLPNPSRGPPVAPRPGPDPGSVTRSLGIQPAVEEGIHFDRPARVLTLHSANKGRVKGSERRRPQTRAARLQSAQNSMEQTEAKEEKPSSNRPHHLTLPNPVQTSLNTEPLPILSSPDLFGPDNVFGSSLATTQPIPSSKPQPNKTTADKVSGLTAMPKREQEIQTTPSLFEDHGGDLFKRVKPRVVKGDRASPFMEEEDDKEDFFALGKNSLASVFTKDTTTISSVPKEDISQDKVGSLQKGSKNKTEKSSLDISLFEDNVDIFADLMSTSKPKAKKKVETKSIFDDDMDDIFSSSAVRPVTSATQKVKKAPSNPDGSEAEDSCSNIFNDPLNALGGN